MSLREWWWVFVGLVSGILLMQLVPVLAYIVAGLVGMALLVIDGADKWGPGADDVEIDTIERRRREREPKSY